MNIWTDGSCLGNPGPGGWAFYLDNPVYSQDGGEKFTTNNRMELEAIRKALTWAAVPQPRPFRVTIFTDSQWAINALTNPRWKIKRNLDLIFEIRNLITCFDGVLFEWVRGHSESPQNNIVDGLAWQAAQRIKEESQ